MSGSYLTNSHPNCSGVNDFLGFSNDKAGSLSPIMFGFIISSPSLDISIVFLDTFIIDSFNNESFSLKVNKFMLFEKFKLVN